MIGNTFCRLVGVLAFVVTVWCTAASAEILSVDELEALAALRYGNATPQQQALLFSRNDAINRAALQGYITDDLYQTAQRNFADTNQRLARDAALEAGAEFRVQTASSATYNPGTDSDYITKVTSPDQIENMQQGYNRRINDYLRQNNVNVSRNDWHVQLDTDFMADPAGVTEDQFRQIAKLNNDAYKRRAAAVYEAVSRAGGDVRVTPEMFTGYAEEMKDFIAKKQKMLAQMRKDPRLLSSPNFQAEFQKIMAQEQKYISRIESSNALLRQQRGLSPLQTLDDMNVWSIRKAEDGTWRLVRDPSIAKLGSVRSAANLRTTAAASALAQNSLENAIERLAQSSAEAAMRDPDFARAAARDIATLLSDFPPARRGQFIETIARNQGDDLAREVVIAMRAEHRAAMQSGQTALRAWGGRVLAALQAAGVAYEVYNAGDALKEYAEAITRALDPNTSEEEAEALFAKADAAAQRLVMAGGLGALFEAYPTIALAMGEFAVVNYGTRWVLENTETGQQIDMMVADLFDAITQAGEQINCNVREFFGYESECGKLRALDQRVLESVLAGIREGRWQLAPGHTMLDVIEAIRDGKYNTLNDILEHSDRWKDAVAAISDLENRLAGLKQRCGPNAANGNAASADQPASDKPRSAVEACHAARQSLTEIRVARTAVDRLTGDALRQFESVERGIAACAGDTQLEQSFATAQAASSNAANAARGFADLMTKVDAASSNVESAKRGAEEALAAATRAEEDCTREINDLIDATAAAHAGIPWDRLKTRVKTIEDAAVGVAETRGEGAGAAERAALANCQSLTGPFEDQLAAMQSILRLDGVPDRRRAIEKDAQACKDKLVEDAPPLIPVITSTAGPSDGDGGTTTGGRSDPVALQNCLCACNRGKTEFDCSYDTKDKGWSPSCRNLDNGPCICKAFGCYRAQPVTSGACAIACRAKYGGGG